MDWSRCYFVTSEIYNILQILLWAFAYYYLVRDFVQKKKTALLTGFTYLAVMLILWYVPYYLSSFWAYLIGVVLSLAVMCLMERKNFLQKIFLAWTFYAVRWLVARIAVTVGSLLWKGSYALEFGIYRCGEGILSVFDRECDRSSYGDSIDSHGIGTDCEDILR